MAPAQISTIASILGPSPFKQRNLKGGLKGGVQGTLGGRGLKGGLEGVP